MNFSIITAVFNNKEHIQSALESVGSQKNVKVEHIVMDGGSTDGTLEIIDRFKDKILFESGKDRGIYDALNKGFRKATQDIVGILHSDDLFSSDITLSKIRELFLNGADVVYGDLDYVQRDNPNQIFRKWRSGTYNELDLSLGWVAPHPSFFVKRTVLEQVGDFNLDYRISGDYDFILRVLTNPKFKVSYLPETLVKMRVGGESNKTIGNKLKGSKEDYRIAKKYFPVPAFTVFSKVTRKIPQLFIR